MDKGEARSRRGVLTAALGAVAGAAVAAVARPEPVEATTATMQTGTTNASDAETRLYRTNDGVVFSAFSTTMPAFQGTNEIVAIGTNISYAPALRSLSSGDNGMGIEGKATGPSGVGVYGNGTTGVVGESALLGVWGKATEANGWAVLGTVTSPGSTGVLGSAGAGSIAVSGGASGGGTGGRFISDTGYALDVLGRTRFNRAGRVSVAANHAYVDVAVPGGLASTAFLIATLQTYRTGVYVAAVRPNYPSTGKARIYLNKVASTTSSTVVGWIAIG